MYLERIPKDLEWSGRLTINDEWGPKDRIRSWAEDCEELFLKPQAEVKGFDEVFGALKEDRSKVSTSIEDKHYTVRISSRSLIAFADFLDQLATEGYTIYCELDQFFNDQPKMGEDVRRLVLHNDQSTKSLSIALYYADWAPVFNMEWPNEYFALNKEKDNGRVVH